MAETVTITRYKSLDGHVYDNLADAERADARWRQENEYDLERDIAQLTKLGERHMQRLRENEEKRISTYPIMYVLDSKHEKQHYFAKNVEAVPQIYFEILKYNRDWEFYYSPAASAISEEIICTENHFAAIAFVKERVDYQYENVYTTSINTYGS